jgi:hydrogenase-4 membrane subunit HyfE
MVKESSKKEKSVFQRIAASVIAFIGIMFMAFNLTITGAVIGSETKITIGTAGMFMVFFALLLFFRPLKRTFKK